jgi:hypothetical protein
MPTEDDRDAAVAYEILNRQGRVGSRICACREARSATCRHLKELAHAYRWFEGQTGQSSPAASFTTSTWYSLAQTLARNNRQPVESIQIRKMEAEGEGGLKVLGHDGRLRLVYHSIGSDRDRESLSTHSFCVAVFDEIQHIKIKLTHAYKAAHEIRADLKIGLTGTPIENSLSELKALMDLTVPGYLGSDSAFSERFLVPIEQHNDAAKRLRLRRIISPFTLRRLKRNVLTELPPKIEDIRTCRLSDEQLKLYQDTIASRGRRLA